MEALPRAPGRPDAWGGALRRSVMSRFEDQRHCEQESSCAEMLGQKCKSGAQIRLKSRFERDLHATFE